MKPALSTTTSSIIEIRGRRLTPIESSKAVPMPPPVEVCADLVDAVDLHPDAIERSGLPPYADPVPAPRREDGRARCDADNPQQAGIEKSQIIGGVWSCERCRPIGVGRHRRDVEPEMEPARRRRNIINPAPPAAGLQRIGLCRCALGCRIRGAPIGDPVETAAALSKPGQECDDHRHDPRERDQHADEAGVHGQRVARVGRQAVHPERSSRPPPGRR